MFARAYGLSFGDLTQRSQIGDLIERAELPGRPASLAVFARGATSYAELDDAAHRRVRELRDELLGQEIASLCAEPPAVGDLVIDVAVAPGEPPWLGAHVHGAQHGSVPGGLPEVEMLTDAPSRAYLKLEEAVARFDLPLRAGQTALELGSAPGGASYALLQRGLTVFGVDPGAIDPRVTAFGARFTHLQMPAGALKRERLPRPVHWLVVDMNIAPRVSLKYLQRVAGPLRRTTLGCILTLKLNDLATAADVPAMLELVRSAGFGRVEARQLPSNHQEICVVGRRAAE